MAGAWIASFPADDYGLAQQYVPVAFDYTGPYAETMYWEPNYEPERHWLTDVVGPLVVGGAFTAVASAITGGAAAKVIGAAGTLGVNEFQDFNSAALAQSALGAPDPWSTISPEQLAAVRGQQEVKPMWDTDWSWGDVQIGDVFTYGNQALDLYSRVRALDDGGDGSGGPDIVISGNGGGNGGMVQTGGVGTAVAAGGVWLGSVLARAFGGAARGAIFTAANGVRVRMAQLWPLVRKYGAESVAGALGITVGALGTLLTRPEAIRGRTGRRRGRGVTAAQVRTTTRTLRTIKKLYRMIPTRPGGSGGRSRRYYYHRHRR